jgi:putative transposase
MIFGFMAKHRGIWPVRMMCETLDVSHSGFYAWLKRPQSRREHVDGQLLGQVRASFAASDETYGARRVWRDLRAWGFDCGLHRIERLMRSSSLKARRARRRRPQDSGERLEQSIANNLLDRQFEALGPNQKWTADFTYLWTHEGWLFVAVVLDLFSRKVVGWSSNGRMTAQLVMDALMTAIWRRGTPFSLLHHSDRGSQYTSERFQDLLDELGIQCSMSRSGNCWDNAVVESFFASMKTERTDHRRYATRDEAKADVFDYIERFYNPKRRHSTLGYVSPIEFENMAATA